MTYNKIPQGSIIEIDAAPYRFVDYSSGRMLFSHHVTGDAFRCEQPDGSLQLPTNAQFEELLASGNIVIRSPRGTHPIRNYNDSAEWTRDQALSIDPEAVARATICQMLDDMGVPQGDQAPSARTGAAISGSGQSTGQAEWVDPRQCHGISQPHPRSCGARRWVFRPVLPDQETSLSCRLRAGDQDDQQAGM